MRDGTLSAALTRGTRPGTPPGLSTGTGPQGLAAPNPREEQGGHGPSPRASEARATEPARHLAPSRAGSGPSRALLLLASARPGRVGTASRDPGTGERDLEDIAAFIRGYITEILGWDAALQAYDDVMAADDFDLDEAGAHALGREIAALLSPNVYRRFVDLVEGLDSPGSRFAAGMGDAVEGRPGGGLGGGRRERRVSREGGQLPPLTSHWCQDWATFCASTRRNQGIPGDRIEGGKCT